MVVDVVMAVAVVMVVAVVVVVAMIGTTPKTPAVINREQHCYAVAFVQISTTVFIAASNIIICVPKEDMKSHIAKTHVQEPEETETEMVRTRMTRRIVV